MSQPNGSVETLIVRPCTIHNQGQVIDLKAEEVYPLPTDVHRFLVALGIGLPFKSYVTEAQ